MHLSKWFAAIFLCLLTMSLVAFGQNVSTDYDHSADFSRYTTYAWLHPPMFDDPLMRQRVEDAVNRELSEKGLRMVSDPGKATLGIVVNGATQEKHTLQTFYDGFPGWTWNGFGTATTYVDTYEVGTLVVDLFDTGTKRIVWRGVATQTLSEKPAKNSKKVDKAITKLFEKYPPKIES